MTAPHTGPVVQAPGVADAVEAMRERGLRVSSVRRLMLDALYGSGEPMTADRLADRVGGQTGTDVASIYRNLELLEEIGLVRHFHLSHSPGLYVRAGGGLYEYLVCDSCRTVKAVDPHELDELRSTLQRQFGWEAHFTHDPIVGLCPACARGQAQ